MKKESNNFSDIDLDRIIEMAWEDRTTFDAIYFQFNLSEAAVKALMKKRIKIQQLQIMAQACGKLQYKTFC